MTMARAPAWTEVKEAIDQYLQREEQIEQRNREADTTWEEYHRTGQFVSHEAMTAWLDAWGTDQEGLFPDLER